MPKRKPPSPDTTIRALRTATFPDGKDGQHRVIAGHTYVVSGKLRAMLDKADVPYEVVS